MKVRMGKVSVKHIVYSVMILAMILTITFICFSTNANAEECNHSFYPTYNYKQLNDYYHLKEYECYSCGATKEEKEEHNLDDYSYENCKTVDDNYHLVYRRCYYCDAIVPTEKEKHDFYTDHYEKIDNDNHQRVEKCYYCDATKYVKENHNVSGISYSDYTRIDDNYHIGITSCYDCGETVTRKQKHDGEYVGEEELVEYKKLNANDHLRYNQQCKYCSNYCFPDVENHDWKAKTLKKATLSKKAKLQYYCTECGAKKSNIFYKKWKKGTKYSLKYGIKSHSDVYSNTTKLRVKLLRPSKGTVVKVKIGKKVYKKKVKRNSRKVVIKIKPPIKFGFKMSIKLLYKGKVVGGDYCYDGDVIWYSTKVKTGMTKRQVRYTWGKPRRKTSSSGGWSYWYYGDGSFVYFQYGRVRSWYNAAG